MKALQTLTLDEVKAKAREFYEAKKLTAQHPDPAKRECVNDGGEGYRCAVAAAFNDDLIGAFSGGTIIGIRERGAVTIDHLEFCAIDEIQMAHDRWAIEAKFRGSDHTATKRAEDEFLALIQD